MLIKCVDGLQAERVADFRLISADASVPITEYRVEGHSLIATVEPLREGAGLIALKLHPHPIILEAEKFAHYVRDEDAAARVAPRFEEGKTITPQRETYTKYAKALLEPSAGENSAFQLLADHRLEIVPQLSPALAQRGGRQLYVQVLFDGEPMANLRITSGCENMSGGRYAVHTFTDERGHAGVELIAPGRWFIRAHYIRPHRDSQAADWESFWASMTFQIHQ